MKLLITSEAAIQGDYISNDEMKITGTNLTFETVLEPEETPPPPPPITYPTVQLNGEFVLPSWVDFTSEYPELRVSKTAPFLAENNRWQEGIELGRLYTENNNGVYAKSIDMIGTENNLYWVSIVSQKGKVASIEIGGNDVTDTFCRVFGSTYVIHSKLLYLTPTDSPNIIVTIA
jgi:hypothetical protein